MPFCDQTPVICNQVEDGSYFKKKRLSGDENQKKSNKFELLKQSQIRIYNKGATVSYRNIPANHNWPLRLQKPALAPFEVVN